MWIVKFQIFIVLIGQIYCEDADIAKVTEINGNNKSSTVTHIRYSNNGGFVSPEANITTQHRISAYDTIASGQCGGIFRNIQTLIESPKFISAKPLCNFRCEYLIMSPYVCDNFFHVQFLEFSIDSSPQCERDRVVINHSDELCGEFVGVRKYRTVGGVLNITFSSMSWDSTEKGFRLLVTRLPCANEIDENQTEIDALEPAVQQQPSATSTPLTPTHDGDDCYHVNASYAVENPTYGNQNTIYGVPYGFNLTNVELNNRQDIPVLPLPPVQPPPFVPPIFTPPPEYPIFTPPPILPQCCRNVYNQQRFLMFSQGFPAYSVLNNDCVYVIHKSSVNACRLRIHFKHFLLDDIQQQQAGGGGQLGCFNNYVEIDGQRICGCKTNFVYETQWGLEPKIIRLHTTPGSHYNAQGFLFDVEQHDCPFKLQSDYGDDAPIRRDKRTILAKKLLLPILMKKQLISSQHQPQHNFLRHHQQQPFYPPVNFDGDDAFRAKFFKNNNNIQNFNKNNNIGSGFINSQCTINHLQLLQLKFETFGVYRHYCLPL